jgi:hypothetical protein
MKKRVIAIVITLAMVFSMIGCGSNSVEESSSDINSTTAPTETVTATAAQADDTQTLTLDKSWPEETVKIGFECYDTTDDQFLQIQKYYEYLAQYYNIELMYSESIASAEDELNFIESCASAGCKAVIGYYNISEEEAVKLCTDKEMYFWGCAEKSSVYDSYADNPYYLGAYDSGEADYNAGYTMGKELIAQGCEKLVYVSGGRDFGVEMFINRDAGFQAAVKEAQAENPNVEIVYDVSGWPGTDSFTAGQTEVCNMDFDAIACSFSAAVWFQPLSVANKIDSIKIATIGVVGDVYYDFANSGIVSPLLYDCEEVYYGFAIPMILNAVAGDGDANRNSGKAANFTVERWVITSPDQYNAIYDKHNADEYYVTAEDVAKCIVHYNPQASYDTFLETYSNRTLDATVSQ